MLEEQIEYFRGNKQEIENEKQRKRELILHFSNILGTVDKTRYVLQDDEKPNTGNHYGERDVNAPTLAVISNEGEKSKEQQYALAVGIPGFENNAKTVNFDSWKESTTFLNPKKNKENTGTTAPKSPFDIDGNANASTSNPFNLTAQYKELESAYSNKPQTVGVGCDSLGGGNMANRLDSVSYNGKGYMSVTFRNDILTKEQFSPFDPNDKVGCKRRCVEMLANSGCELSGERIDMTINNEKGRAITKSNDFQKGINAIDDALNKEQVIILNVDYRDGTASSADKAGDHFIVVVGKTVIDGTTYYHFYDPATQFTDYGTANTNVLYIKDGFLQGNFLTKKGDVKEYKVSSVRLNK